MSHLERGQLRQLLCWVYLQSSVVYSTIYDLKKRIWELENQDGDWPHFKRRITERLQHLCLLMQTVRLPVIQPMGCFVVRKNTTLWCQSESKSNMFSCWIQSIQSRFRLSVNEHLVWENSQRLLQTVRVCFPEFLCVSCPLVPSCTWVFVSVQCNNSLISHIKLLPVSTRLYCHW